MGNINLQSFPPKRKTRDSLIRGLDFESVAKLTARKGNCVREFGPKRVRVLGTLAEDVYDQEFEGGLSVGQGPG